MSRRQKKIHLDSWFQYLKTRIVDLNTQMNRAGPFRAHMFCPYVGCSDSDVKCSDNKNNCSFLLHFTIARAGAQICVLF